MADKSVVNNIVKYTLFFVNIVLFLVFGAATAVTAYVISQRETPIKSFFEYISDWPCLICTVAGYLCLMTLAGWIGALRDNKTFLLVFRIMLLLIVILELLLVILIFLLVYEPSVQALIYDESTYREAIIRYRDPQYESLHETIDSIQKNWKCCGVSDNAEGYKDWAVNEYFNCTDDLPHISEFCSVPYSCCKMDNERYINYQCGKDMARSSTDSILRAATIYTTGCFMRLQEILMANILWIGIAAIVVIIPELVFYKLASTLSEQISIQRAKWDKPTQNFDRLSRPF